MIVPDVNLLVHAYATGSSRHDDARRWWKGTLDSQVAVGLAWVAIIGYVRIITNARFMKPAQTVETAEADVRAWLACRNVVVVHPTERHADLVFGFLRSAGAAGNLTTDAHLAALAVEHDAEIASADADFSRFPGVRSTNPLA